MKFEIPELPIEPVPSCCVLIRVIPAVDEHGQPDEQESSHWPPMWLVHSLDASFLKDKGERLGFGPGDVVVLDGMSPACFFIGGYGCWTAPLGHVRGRVTALPESACLLTDKVRGGKIVKLGPRGLLGTEGLEAMKRG